jgi:EAL domain-containing protein (putative c-di-GMP-specific phosphodiesterase class I)
VAKTRRGLTQDLFPNLKGRLGFTDLQVAFQPLVDVSDGRLFAYEALCRVQHPSLRGPIEFFGEAIRQELVGELGRLVRHAAISACADTPLFLNVHPKELDDGWLIRPDDPIFVHEQPIFIEITESVPMSKESYTYGQIRELRAKGVQIVVDDLGAGYSNLKYIADLEPEVVKLDRSLITEIESDRVFRLVRAITRLCADLNAKVVAEGIERVEELARVREAGVQLAQGYYIAKPALAPPQPSEWLSRFGGGGAPSLLRAGSASR